MEFKVNFHQGSHKLQTNFASPQVATVYPEGAPYNGSYNITPTVEEQVLPTAQKMMKEDMTVKAIPYYNVSNSAGGSTVYIGSEV